MKKLKKETKKKVSSKDSNAKPSSKKKHGGSDEDHASPPRSHVNVKEEDDDSDDDDVQWQTDTSLEAAKQRIQEQLNAATAEMVMLSTVESEKKKSKAATQTPSPKAAASVIPEKSKTENGETNHERLVREVKANLKKGVTASKLQSFLGSLSGSPQEVVTALYEALFDGVEKGFAKEVIKKKSYLAAVAQDEESQLRLLRAIEEFSGKCNAAALKEVALVLKALYDADLLEEVSIVEWYNKGVAADKDSKIWKNVKPFIEWLQSAESESE